MVQDKVELAFGALLHDIGKIVYRGSSSSGTHSKLGAAFISEEVAALNSGFDGEIGKKIVEQIRFHHASEMSATKSLSGNSLAWITYFADNISAGMDRKNEGGDDQAAFFDREVKLRKIFNIINGHTDDNTIEHEDYNSIRERIKGGLAGIEVSARGINSLLNLLEATTHAVPSSTNMAELVDVSLFDHVKTTAGIAACIYEYFAEQGTTDYKKTLFDKQESQEMYSRNMFLLYSWDMSGIQSFIYNISGDGALKQLRARSLYLEMMLEHTVDELLDRLGLSRANLLYTGGGHAYMLLPNTENVKALIEVFKEDLQAWLLEHYRTDLYLAGDWVECCADDLANRGEDKQRYRNLYRRLSQKLTDEKAARYSSTTIKELNHGSVASLDYGRECTECLRSDLHINSEGKCTICAALGRISKTLVEKDVFVVTGADPPEATADSTNELDKTCLILPFDRVLSMYSVEEYKIRPPEGLQRIYTKNNWHTGIDLATHIWMGDYTAKQEREEGIRTYAKNSSTLENGLGIERLGVLRADVDNLGAVFAGSSSEGTISGLPDNKISISRTATLSRALSYFFKAQINEVLAAKNYEMQIVYSGGDDMFIIGNWSDIIHAALEIRRALDELTGNGSLTISAGIGMFDSKYPIARMASEVGELEDCAKQYPNRVGATPTKDAIALWSTQAVFSWDEFIDNVQTKYNEVARLFDKNEKGKAFIYRLLDLLRNTEDEISFPRLAYLLAKSFEDDKEHGTEASRKIYDWASDKHERKYLVAAIEWYVYSIRERG
ncbi:MAG: type III-A CRISPR-associated protein Cas10/Csm1 [Coriobacteriales bacterium]|jgi:CRISPR-associated protein Csm1|nr:type III-A CRISPR-associated protein Cas10/Csm1 [Coriobacteriales bacterium]